MYLEELLDEVDGEGGYIASHQSVSLVHSDRGSRTYTGRAEHRRRCSGGWCGMPSAHRPVGGVCVRSGAWIRGIDGEEGRVFTRISSLESCSAPVDMELIVMFEEWRRLQ